MRFKDWDVLLFPLDSSAPLQEFRTSCHGIETELGRTAMINTFISSMPMNQPFRISIHSWAGPTFSDELTSRLSEEDGARAVWGVKVFIDGHAVYNGVFSDGLRWPVTIDATQRSARLLFPPFHESILHRRKIDVAEDLGRIKVLLSEGYTSSGVSTSRLRPVSHVACFSFMHAPLGMLENLNIAWPNNHIYGIEKSGPEIYFLPRTGRDPAMQTVSRDPGLSPFSESFLGCTGADLSDAHVPSSSRRNESQMLSSMAAASEHESYALSTRCASWKEPDTGFKYTRASGKSTTLLPDLFLRATDDMPRSVAGRGLFANSEYGPRHRPPHGQSREDVVKSSLQSVHAAAACSVHQMNSISEAKKPSGKACETSNNRSDRQPSYASDISMHTACVQFPDCIVDDPRRNGSIHDPKSGNNLQPTSVTSGSAHGPAHRATSGSSEQRGAEPLDQLVRKRNRSVLGAKDANAPLTLPPKSRKTSNTKLETCRVVSQVSEDSVQ